MAKGNLFLGTAAKSVGDVVMYRREGSQVSRVRVRKIANPKTDAQCRQRAIMAPIPKFFSPLAIVLERSFEGLSKSKSYSKFIQVNADKARANDWLLPKGSAFFPMPYQLSQGTLPICRVVTEGNAFYLMSVIGESSASLSTIGDLSSAFIGAGYQEGDVVTFIIAKGDNQAISSRYYIPVTFQFVIDSTSTVAIETAMPGLRLSFSDEAGGMLHVDTDGGQAYAAAVIIARFEGDKWRRSTQNLEVRADVMASITSDSAKAAAIASYGNTAGEPNPLVYLDGDELQ